MTKVYLLTERSGYDTESDPVSVHSSPERAMDRAQRTTMTRETLVFRPVTLPAVVENRQWYADTEREHYVIREMDFDE